MTWTVFVLLRATPDWLAQSEQDRETISQSCLGQAMVDDRVTMRFYDAEAFSAPCSDVAVFETRDLGAYYFVMERLRSTALFSTPYFEVIQIIPAIEDGHRVFQQTERRRAQ